MIRRRLTFCGFGGSAAGRAAGRRRVGGAGRRRSAAVVDGRDVLLDPWRIAIAGKVFETQEGDGQTDDGRLVQLRSDGRRKRKHFGQFVEFVVFFSSPRPGSIPRLFFSHLENAVEKKKEEDEVSNWPANAIKMGTDVIGLLGTMAAFLLCRLFDVLYRRH